MRLQVLGFCDLRPTVSMYVYQMNSKTFLVTQTVYDDVTVHSIKHTRGNFAAAMIQIDNERNVSSAAQVGFTISQTTFPTLALELYNTLFVYKNPLTRVCIKGVSIVHQLCTELN